MCNAHNHRPGCTCGWGGMGHLGGGFNSTSFHTTSHEHGWLRSISPTYESFINPNASCPVCGASVFFYQSPSGGCVFFDEFGPPWPKHPCTDQTSLPNEPKVHLSEITPKNKTKYRWQTSGWHPFLIQRTSRIDEFSIKVHGVRGKKEMIIFVNYAITSHKQENIITSSAHIKNINNSTYQLSILTNNGNITTLNAFELLSEARVNLKTKSQIKAPNKPKVKKPKDPKNKAMAIAFANAQKKKDEN